jgi:signal peptidase I
MSTEETEIKPIGEPRPIGPPKSIAREYFESFVVTLIMAIFGMTFILQAVTVPTGSMQNTILVGDYLLVNKFIFAPSGNPLPFLPQRDVQRGDIIVFKYPGFPNNTAKVKDSGGIPYQINFVKRVIGLPGDKVEFRNNQVYINDQLLPEHRIVADLPVDRRGQENDESALIVKAEEPWQNGQNYSTYYSEDSMQALSQGRTLNERFQFGGQGGPPTIVPENSYFVMGDSRDKSLDSRFWGFVPRELIVGRAMFVYWSCDRAASGGSMLGCITNPRLDRIGKMIK